MSSSILATMSTDEHGMSEESSQKSLTPQRKHRKLLKDGSGTEVWPESIENIFVQGLREYWKSPWASYSQSRGRSRWRNQFLVDYLQRAGIIRTKKQVASHIQVLRNMWKGEPEYQLVAGGDEASLEAGGAVKLEDQCDPNTLIRLDFDENDATSSNSTTPNFSPPNNNTEFPLSPAMSAGTHLADQDSMRNSKMMIFQSKDPNVTRNIGFLAATSATESSAHPSDQVMWPSKHPQHQGLNHPLDTYFPSASPNPDLSFASSINPSYLSAMIEDNYRIYASSYPSDNLKRVTAVFLHADGMTPFSVKVDALLSPGQPTTGTALALKIKLSMDYVRCPSTLHGFVGAMYLSNGLIRSGKCVTKVYAGNTCISEEVAPLDLSGPVAVLPDSSLTRCRWLDTSAQTITQEIVANDETLIYNIYNLDRRNGSVMPSVELMGYHWKYHTAMDKTATPHQIANLPPSHSFSPCMTYPFPRRPTQTSLSCALTPVNNIRPVAASMTF